MGFKEENVMDGMANSVTRPSLAFTEALKMRGISAVVNHTVSDAMPSLPVSGTSSTLSRDLPDSVTRTDVPTLKCLSNSLIINAYSIMHRKEVYRGSGFINLDELKHKIKQYTEFL